LSRVQTIIMASSSNPKEGHLQKRFSKITMIGMAFAILK
jgi:hypothetical protein